MNEKLRFVSDDIFAEAEPPDDRRERPLEWRRSFNPVELEITQLTFDTFYEVNEVDLIGDVQSADATGASTSVPRVIPAAKLTRRIHGRVSTENMRDTLLRSVRVPDDASVFELQRLRGDIAVTIFDSAPVAARGEYAEGSFPGMLFPADGDDGGQAWTLDISIPSVLMDDLAQRLRSGDFNCISAGIAVQSFSDEVDDALREWHSRRRLFIHKTAAAAPCRRLVARKSKGVEPATEDAEPERNEQVDLVAPPVQAVHPVNYTAALGGIKVALWAVAAVEFLRLLK